MLFCESALCFVSVHAMSEVRTSCMGLLNDEGCVLLLGLALLGISLPHDAAA